MSRVRSLAGSVAVVLVAVAGFVAVGASSAGAATITGGDKGGADITVANGDVLSGT